MSNSYSTNLLLADPSSTVAGKNVDYQTPQRMANSINYSYAVGASHNVLSQSYSDRCFIQDSSSFVEMSQWRIPLVSLDHDELEVIAHYDIIGTSSNCNLRLTVEVDTASTSLTLNLPSSAEIASDSFTVTFPGSNQYYATVTLEIQADSANNAEVVLKSIMARWKPINSPISAGRKKQYTTTPDLTPFGTSRTGINQAFTSRFAHNMIDNIQIVRERMQSYLTWSSCYSANSSIFSNPEDAGVPEIYLGAGHIRILGGYPLVPSGYDALNHKKLELHVRSVGDYTNTEFEFFGNIINLTNSAGSVDWSIHTIDIDYEKMSRRGDILLPYFDASLDNSETNLDNLVNYGSVANTDYPTVTSGIYGNILSICLMGI